MRDGAKVKLATSPTVMLLTATVMPSCMSLWPKMKERATGFDELLTSVPSRPPEDNIEHRTCTTHLVDAPGSSQSSFSHRPPSPEVMATLRTDPSLSRSFSLELTAANVLAKENCLFSLATSSRFSCRNWSWTFFNSARASRFCGSFSAAASRSALASPSSRWPSALLTPGPSCAATRASALRKSAFTFEALIFNASLADFSASPSTLARSGSSAGRVRAYLVCTNARFVKLDSQMSFAAFWCCSVCFRLG
mmetsp:Transcript_49931/g.129603  ORF Transcript_49931/g.129603 Transcript_49931/m.129603 type:complete len:251 (-) Transcript_49931:148-900(-)